MVKTGIDPLWVVHEPRFTTQAGSACLMLRAPFGQVRGVIQLTRSFGRAGLVRSPAKVRG